jgi:DNA-binding IclR family transcriptional regulator
MPQTFMRGLEMVQYVDLHGVVTIGELAQEFSVDKGTVSRLVTAAEVDGWLIRTTGGVTLGPRSALLGDTTPVAYAVHEVRPLLEAVVGATGVGAQALILSGSRAVGIATAGPAGTELAGYLRRPKFPLWAGGGGKVIASQLTPEELTRFLPPDPFPDTAEERAQWDDIRLHRELEPSASDSDGPRTRVSTRRELDAQLAEIRRSGSFREYGEMLPSLGCIAVPWTRYGIPGALATVAPLDQIEAGRVVIEAVLHAAARAAATRDDVTLAAAAALTA